MDESFRQPAKLQKRKSRERQELAMSGGLGGQPANSSQPLAPADNVSPNDKEKKSKWRMSNPFHSKDKSKDKDVGDQDRDRKNVGDRKDVPERKDLSDTNTNGDSAYYSSEANTSANPSFASNPRPISGEQWHPPPSRPDAPAAVNNPPNTTYYNPPNSHTHDTLAPPQQLHSRSSQESVGRETYQDAGSGNIVTVTTTTTTTTTTTSGPGGSTTVEQPVGSKGVGSITNTSGPSPPSPASPLPANHQHHQTPGLPTQSSIPESLTPPMPTQYQQGAGLTHEVSRVEEPSPAIPNKSNIRNRLELDSVSPAIQRPNPMDSTVSPITPSSPGRANFSYPARQPPQGVPRQVPSQYGAPVQQSEVPPMPTNLQPGSGYNDPSRPLSFRASHDGQRQSTMANLKAAAAGIHVRYCFRNLQSWRQANSIFLQGAGETLRGTFNDTFDRRNPAAHAKNQAIIDAGRSEIEAARGSHQQRPPVTALPPSPTKTPYLGPPVSGSQIEGRSESGGRLGNIMKKMKEGPLASNRDGTMGQTR